MIHAAFEWKDKYQVPSAEGLESLAVFIPFHWVFEAEEERKERKEREKGEIVGNQAHLLCFVKSTV